jgi:hypothetical protein
MAAATAFYPSISYGTTPTLINFGASEPREVASTIEINEAAIRKQNVSEDGTTETLFLRFETQVRLSFQFLTKATLDALRTWWRGHAGLGNASVLVLDRLGTAGGQIEYDTYNAFFTLAELVDVQWQPRRTTPRGIHYALSLTFRQGTVPSAPVVINEPVAVGARATQIQILRRPDYLAPEGMAQHYRKRRSLVQ